MSDLAIHVEKLSKQYRIGKAVTASNGRGKLLSTLASPFRYLISSLRPAGEEEVIWALDQVSFDVQRSEIIGIIGRNGAGKSTLLKILSRITEPTRGRALVHGRVGSLLEVGTGFHPELTGRENVYLNGAILGMKKFEIDRKFDEIVAFSEVEKFIDTPVKRYSSGMYVRLAFSVAAHLEPEILLVDEVLAVGDLAFQQKCLNRIKTLTTSGMTILLVSHNMAAIQSSCTRALFVDRGKIAAEGETLEVIEAYRRSLQSQDGIQEELSMLPGEDRAGGQAAEVEIRGFQMFGVDGASRREFQFGEPIRIQIDLLARPRVDFPMINFGVRRGDGVVVCNFNNWYDNFKIDYLEGECRLEGYLPPLRLVPDFYEAHVLVWPWGGGHLAGLNNLRPLAWKTFGDFRTVGPPLNSHDGVFQMPALRWCFTRGTTAVEFSQITGQNLDAAFRDIPKES